MKTILITGGCGFIGSHFVRLVLRNPEYQVVNLDKLTYAGNLQNLIDVEGEKNYCFVKGDIADETLVDRLFREERPGAVVNFAAESHVDRSILDPSPFIQTNVIGVQVLLEAARRHGVERFVQVSTDEVYGDADAKEVFHEDSPLTPSSPYAATKAAADLFGLAYQRTYGLPVLITRSSNNYGPFQFPEKLIPLLIRNALGGEDLPVYGDGLQSRDWLHVEVNAEAIFQVLEKGQIGSIYNVGTGEERTNIELVRAVCHLLAEEAGLDLKKLLSRIRMVADRPGHDRRYALNTRKIREDLGWSSQVPFETGLRGTVRWYLDHQAWVKQVTSGEYQAYYEAVYSQAWGRTST